MTLDGDFFNKIVLGSLNSSPDLLQMMFSPGTDVSAEALGFLLVCFK